ncbi:MAG: hypothetical protein AAFR96_06545 [Planctomycetota bacterium]
MTKILVVFASVLSLALAALTSTYALNARTITDRYNDEVARASDANARYELQSSQFADERADLQAEIQSRDAQLADLDRDRLGLLSELEELRIEAKQALDQAARIERQIGDLGKSADTQSTLITSLTEEVRTLRDENLTARTDQIDLLARLNDLENQNDVLTQTNRALQEALVEVQNEFDRGGVASQGGLAGEPSELAGPTVRGRVRAVRMSDGEQLVEIDLGTRDRVRENVRLFITRGDRYVADLKIVRAEIQTSVGQVDALGRAGVQVREGDIVLSSLD